MAALAKLDQAYAVEIVSLRKAVQDIAATPEGAVALARFNAGDEEGALAILDDPRKARDVAAARRIATLALEARQRGKQTTGQLIARFEELTRLDPGTHWDWIELGRLYMDAGQLAGAASAASAAASTTADDRDRSAAFAALGDVLVAQGDGPGALAAYRKSLAIHEPLAARDLANTQWQRDLIPQPERLLCE